MSGGRLRFSVLSSRRFSSPKEDNLSQSIHKAINNDESPVKEKHLRTIIMGTFEEKGALTFWSVALKLPLLKAYQTNPVPAWKFCYVLHKVLRKGHPQVVGQSQCHRGMLESLGTSWGHGSMIEPYSKLLITKLDFHRRNPQFPGNLVVDEEEFKLIGENDSNKYFEVVVEMLDYLDDILTLQSAIFDSLDSVHTPAMPTGLCRFAPLIPCIQDSSSLYHYCVKILFRLHSSLPPETLTGYDKRFLKQFRALQKFYIEADNLQDFKNLIHIPLLPENPPNFLNEVDLGRYVAPLAVPFPETEEEADDTDEFSICSTDDFSDTISELGDGNESFLRQQIEERDRLIRHLQNEMSYLKENVQHLRTIIQTREKELSQKMYKLGMVLALQDSKLSEEKQLNQNLQTLIAKLETDLAMKDQELLEEKYSKERLREQMEATSKNLKWQTFADVDVLQHQEKVLTLKIVKLERDLATEKNSVLQSRQIRDIMQAKIAELEKSLDAKDEELRQERHLKEHLLQRMEEAAKHQEREDRAKTMEEKFQKSKEDHLIQGHRNGSVSPEQLAERDHLLQQLQNEITRLRDKIQYLRMEFQKQTEELRDKIEELEADLATKDSELLQERQLKEDLLRHTEEASKYHEYEKRAKTMEEKFQKLKEVYGKLREEHIQLIRKKKEVDKQLATAKQTTENAVRVKEELSAQPSELLYEKSKTEETLVKSGEIAKELAFPKYDELFFQEAVEKEKSALLGKLKEPLKEKQTLESHAVQIQRDNAQQIQCAVDMNKQLKKMTQRLGENTVSVKKLAAIFELGMKPTRPRNS